MWDSVEEFRSRCRDTAVFGCFSKTTDSSIVEAMGRAGLDFVILDMEHGPIGFETLRAHILASEVSGVAPIVRVPHHRSEAIGKALDLGAFGVQVPTITSAADAAEVVSRAKFHPRGARGLCRYVRAADYATLDKDAYLAKANEALVVLHLEGREGLAAFDEIVDVAGVDILFIGPYDLSQSLGVPGDIEDPLVVGEMESLAARARERSVVVGTFCESTQQLSKWRDLGVTYLAYSVDISIFIQGVEGVLSQVGS